MWQLASWEWDLKRLAASVVIAGRHLGLLERDSARAARATVRAYREHMAEYSFMHALDVWYDRIDIAGKREGPNGNRPIGAVFDQIGRSNP